MVIALSISEKTEEGISTISSSLKSKWPLNGWIMPILLAKLSEAVVYLVFPELDEKIKSKTILLVPSHEKGCKKLYVVIPKGCWANKLL